MTNYNLKLTKRQKKNLFHLPVEQAVYVPSTKQADKKISDVEMRRRVAQVRKYLSQKFGGYTSTKSIGGYYSTNKKKLIKEKVTVVTSFAEKPAFNKNKTKLLNKMKSWGRNWGQESMGYSHEGDMYYIPTKKMKRKKLSETHLIKLRKNLAKARRVKARRK